MNLTREQVEEGAVNKAWQTANILHGERMCVDSWVTADTIREAIRVWNEYCWIPIEIDPPHDHIILFQTDYDEAGNSEFTIGEWRGWWSMQGKPPRTPYTRWRFL